MYSFLYIPRLGIIGRHLKIWCVIFISKIERLREAANQLGTGQGLSQGGKEPGLLQVKPPPPYQVSRKELNWGNPCMKTDGEL